MEEEMVYRNETLTTAESQRTTPPWLLTGAPGSISQADFGGQLLAEVNRLAEQLRKIEGGDGTSYSYERVWAEFRYVSRQLSDWAEGKLVP